MGTFTSEALLVLSDRLYAAFRECVEGLFSEVRLEGVLRSAPRKDMLQLYLISREPFTLSQGRFLLSF